MPSKQEANLDYAFRKTPQCDMMAIKEAMQTALDAGMYKSQKRRLYDKLQLFADVVCCCEDVNVVLQILGITASTLSVTRLLAHDPLALNTKMRGLFANEGCFLWKVGSTGTTWPIYNQIQQLGLTS